jgi:hypothetical protein
MEGGVLADSMTPRDGLEICCEIMCSPTTSIRMYRGRQHAAETTTLIHGIAPLRMTTVHQGKQRERLGEEVYTIILPSILTTSICRSNSNVTCTNNTSLPHLFVPCVCFLFCYCSISTHLRPYLVPFRSTITLDRICSNFLNLHPNDADEEEQPSSNNRTMHPGVVETFADTRFYMV